MQIQAFATKWFALYYPVLGILFFTSGVWLIVKPRAGVHYLLAYSRQKKPPLLIRNILKYFFLFALPGLIFSLILLSWIELLFSVWSLLMVYIIGIQLVRWPQTRQSIRDHSQKIPKVIKISGATMLAVSMVMFLLSFLVIKRLIAF